MKIIRFWLKVSVIIPTFNRAQFLGETLDSIIAQSFENWECLIIDDVSADYTIELLEFYREKDARISYYKSPEINLKEQMPAEIMGLKSVEEITFYGMIVMIS